MRSSSTLLLTALVSASTVGVVAGSCSRDVDAIYSDEKLSNATQKMIVAFSETCSKNGDCQASDYEETLVATNKLIRDAGGPEESLTIFGPGLDQEDVNGLAEDVSNNVDNEKLAELVKENSPPIILTASVDFSSFTNNPDYVDYEKECERLGATVTPVDVRAIIKGDKGFANILQQITKNGFEMDVNVEMYSVPVCLASSCDREDDLSDVVDQVIGEVLLNVNLEDLEGELPDGLDEGALEQIMKVATIKNFCLFGTGDGLDECSFTVVRSGGGGGGGSQSKSTSGATSFDAARFTMAALFATTLFVSA